MLKGFKAKLSTAAIVVINGSLIATGFVAIKNNKNKLAENNKLININLPEKNSAQEEAENISISENNQSLGENKSAEPVTPVKSSTKNTATVTKPKTITIPKVSTSSTPSKVSSKSTSATTKTTTTVTASKVASAPAPAPAPAPAKTKTS